MNMRLEVVPIPVTDVDRSVAFYKDTVGFNLDHDVKPGNGMRVVQLTPLPGSIKNLHLVVDDIESARDLLLGHGVEIGEIHDMGGVMYAYFEDPDGNSWALQEITLNAKL